MSQISYNLDEQLSALVPQADALQRERIAAYLSMVDRYRKVLNLTGFSGFGELIYELAVESARLLELGPIPPGTNCIDLGSGVGTPVVVLALLCPEARFVAVESRERRATFLRQVAAQLKLNNLSVLQQHTSDFGVEHALAYGLVTARAFAQLETYLRTALPLLRPDGEIRGYIGAGQELDSKLLADLKLVLRASLDYEASASRRCIYSLARGL